MLPEFHLSLTETGQLKIDLSSPPAWLTGVLIILPDGKTVTYGLDSAPSPTIETSNLVTQYLKYKTDDGLKPRTVDGYASVLRAFAACCPAWPVDSETIRDFLNQYRTDDYSPVTAADYRRDLNNFFKWAIQMGYLQANPLLNVPKFKAPITDIDDRIIPPETLYQVIEYLEGIISTTCPKQAHLPHERAIRDLAIIRLAYATACRLGEIASLEMSKLDSTQHTAIILASLTKNKRKRNVCFSESAQAALLDWFRVRPDGISNQVFLGAKGNGWSNKRYNEDSISHMWVDRQKEAGVTKLHRFHDIRHTHITHSLDADVPMHHVSAQAGHSSTRVTADIYTHSVDVERRAAYQGRNPDDLLEEKVKGKKGKSGENSTT